MVNLDLAINIIDTIDYPKQSKLVPLLQAQNKIIAEDIYAPIDVPSFNKSAMDGYGIKKQDLDNFETFEVVETIYAGDDKPVNLKPGQSIKVMTGGHVIDDVDYVIQKEKVNIIDEQTISFKLNTLNDNTNICLIGEDIQKGTCLYNKGTKLTATKLAVLASVGIKEVLINQPPKILLITTGDEVREDTTTTNQIFNSNKIYLIARLNELGITDINHIHLQDDLDTLIELTKTFKDYDLVISTGAISMGDKDILRLIEKEKILIDKINIMPGGPCMVWQHDNTNIFSLAGSPFANLVTFELLVTRYLANLLEDQKLKLKNKQLKLNGNYKKEIKKTRFLKAYYEDDKVYISDQQLASAIFDMSQCNCLIKLPAGSHDLKTNDIVDVYIMGSSHA